MAATGSALRERFDDMDACVEAMSRSGGTVAPKARGPWRAEGARAVAGRRRAGRGGPKARGPWRADLAMAFA